MKIKVCSELSMHNLLVFFEQGSNFVVLLNLRNMMAHSFAIPLKGTICFST
jgi:hypothetical protein